MDSDLSTLGLPHLPKKRCTVPNSVEYDWVSPLGSEVNGTWSLVRVRAKSRFEGGNPGPTNDRRPRIGLVRLL